MSFRVRHKTPSIFNLSMVDVVFCTLGCVILLWLWKMEQETALSREKEAAITDRDTTAGLLKDMTTKLALRDNEINTLRDELKKSGVSIEELTALLAASKTEREKLIKERKELDEQVASLKKEKEDLDKAIAQVKKDLAEKDVDYKASQKRAEDLDKKLKDLAVQLAKVEVLAGKVPGLELEVTKAKKDAEKEKLTTKELEERIAKRIQDLTDLTAKLEKIQKALDSTTTDKEKLSDLLTKTDKKSVDLQKLLDEKIKELEEAAKKYNLVQAEKGKWQIEAQHWETVSKNRFAGIKLDSKRVVFLLDMSGSMELLAEKVPAPTKWAEVQATLVLLLKSMPSLEEYQIIGFADNTRFLMGSEGKWIKFDRTKTPNEVAKVLAEGKNRPNGGTNMYAAMEAAFAMRDKGLDTVFLLSDGLPNEGQGLTDNEKKTLSQREVSEKLGQYVRSQLSTRLNKPDQNKQRVRVNSVGFYFESPDLGAFLWALSRENDGNFVGMSQP